MNKILPLALFLSALIVSSNAHALDFPHREESKYFTVVYQEGVDPLDVAYNIKREGLIYLSDEKWKVTTGDNPKDILIRNVDALFNEVSDILDMHLYSYHGNIKICRNREELKKIFYEIFNAELKSESFYYHEENIIFVNAENLKPGILAHEMAHAIINHYFVVIPPLRVQEVLAGYVE